MSKENNVVTLSGDILENTGDEEDKTAFEQMIEQANEIDWSSLLMIGIAKDGSFYILDSERSYSNISYLTDIAKAMITKGH